MIDAEDAQDEANDATGGANDTTRTVGEAALTEATEERELQPHEDAWEAPRVNEQGFAIDPEGLPINRRLRALALAEAGATTDPGKLIADEDIADAAERRSAYERDYPAISARSTTAELEARAKAEGVDISGASNNQERADLILAARPALV